MKKGTVLLIDDEPDTRDLLARAFERGGYDCLTAPGVDGGLAHARRADFIDVVVTDVVLGKDDRGGLRLLTELRTIGVRAPIVVITAYADVEKVKIALNEGAAHLLEKPFRAQELIDVVERVRSQGGTAKHTVEQFLGRAQLTDKERRVALRLLEGLSGDEIAEVENNSTKTIRQHVTQIYKKCGVRSRGEFFRLAYVR